jgi:leucyl/phenylalanyl-tRNA--protein transferase
MRTRTLTPELLVSAYSQACFPMDVRGEIRWYQPDPRAIIELDELRVSRNVRQIYRNRHFEIRIDHCFEHVIRACSRPGQQGSWISEEIIEAYTEMHRLGLAHSVESWKSGELAGGLYGVTLGGAFFGESMFHWQTNASKVALVALVERMQDRGFVLLDVQFLTPHLQRLGAKEIPHVEYVARLERAIRIDTQFAS